MKRINAVTNLEFNVKHNSFNNFQSLMSPKVVAIPITSVFYLTIHKISITHVAVRKIIMIFTMMFLQIAGGKV